MKKFTQTAVLIAGLAGLAACSSVNSTDYQGRTAGHTGGYGMSSDAKMSSDSSVDEALAMCQERARRLEDMNKSCYRK